MDGKVENYDEMFWSLKELGRKMDVEILDKPFQELGTAKGSYVEYQALNSRGEMENRKAIELNPRISILTPVIIACTIFIAEKVKNPPFSNQGGFFMGSLSVVT
jgi:hypothetical protein